MIKDIKHINIPEYAHIVSATVTTQDMGESTITAQVKIDGDIRPDFSFDWEVEFKGERYIHPLRKPQATKENTSLSSTIDLTFKHWAVHELQRYFFVEMTSVESGTAIADKYIASMSLNLGNFVTALNNVLKHYYGGRITAELNHAWSFYEEPTFVNISYSYIWDVLIKMYETYGIRWTLETSGDKCVIKFGYDATELDHVFEYGFEGGLLKVERQVQSDNIRNILLGRGGEKNIPYRYFKDVDPQNPSFPADPDWIPELANMHFSELRESAFRSYVQGWKARHYGGTVTKAQAAVDWAWERGYNDSKFYPVEFVKDDTSIEKYGQLWGGLENNQEIYPTIQGITRGNLGRIDQVVAVEKIESDDVEEAVEAETKYSTIATHYGNSNFITNKEKNITFKSIPAEFSVNYGMKANIEAGAVDYSATKVNKVTGRYYTREDVSANVIVSVDTINVYKATKDANGAYVTSGEKIPSVDIPAGNYIYEVVFRAENDVTFDEDKHIIQVSAKLRTANLEESTISGDEEKKWLNTFDIWVKNIWDTTKLSTESEEDYVKRVWTPILGDHLGGEAKVVFSSGWLSLSEDYEFTMISPLEKSIHYDTSKTHDGAQSHWRLTLAKSDADLDTLGVYLPNTKTNASAGDFFFFIGIDLPYMYYTEAEKRLTLYKQDALKEVSDIKPTWVVTLDKVRIANTQPNEVETLLSQLKAGASLPLADRRFITDVAYEKLYLQSVTYTYNEPSQGSPNLIPDVEVVLSDKYQVVANPVEQIQGQIDSLSQNFVGVSQIEQLVRRVGDKLYLRKDGFADRSYSPTAFASLLTSLGFRQGMLGGAGWGFFKDENGKWVMETDRLNVRDEMQVNTLVINQITARGGMIIESSASIEVTSVNETEDGVVCYFDQKFGTVGNLFKVDDIAFSQRFDTDNSILKMYKRRIVAVDENSITLSTTDVYGDGAPQEGDVIVQYGNYTDKERQFVIVRDVIGGGYERMIGGLDSVTATGYEYFFAGYQSSTGERLFIGNKQGNNWLEYKDGKLTIAGRITVLSEIENTDGTYSQIGDYLDGIIEQLVKNNEDIYNFIENIVGDNLEDIQKQIDGVIETWFIDEEPTLTNAPAKDWTTENEREKHSGDLCYNNTTGTAYRFSKDEHGNWFWNIITDEAITKALEAAKNAQDTADGKRRVFVSQPNPPYDAGDLWVNATYGTKYKDDILRCISSKSDKENFNIDDWTLASKYTDDTLAEAAKKAADDAAEQAKNATDRLNDWASDSYISPQEKTALKQQHNDIKSEYQEIIKQAENYGIPTNEITSAYNKANNALEKYTKESPENIPVESDYNDIAAYYTARQHTLEAIATYIKNSLENSASLIVSLSNEYQGIPANADGTITNFPTCSTSVSVFNGTQDVSNDATYTQNGVGLTGTWNNATKTYTVTALSAESGYVDIKATYKGLSTTKRFNVVKVRAGHDGTNGTSITILSQSVMYQKSTSGTDVPKGTWLSNIPTTVSGEYLWTRTIVNYSDGNSTTSYSVAAHGVNGVDGKSVTYDQSNSSISYAISAYGTPNNGGDYPSDITSWSPTVPSPQKGKFLWTRDITAYNNGGVIETTTTYGVSYYGTDGTNGTNGTSVTVDESKSKTEYAVGDSGTTKPASGWSTTIPSVAEGKYLWTRVTTVYSDGSSTVSYGVSYIGKDGTNGTNGKDGTSVEIDTANTYVRYSTVLNSPTQPSDSTFTLTTIPSSLAQGNYLWSLSRVAYTDGTILKSYSVSRLGTDGDDGVKGADGMTTHFAYATSANGQQNFSTKPFTGATYIGTYTDDKQADSTNYADYTWTQWRGDDGTDVEIDASRTYVRYSTVHTAARPADSTFTLSSPPALSAGDYLWILSQTAYVGVSEPLKSYSVSRIGTDGEDGDPGTDGYTTHFAYAKLKSGQTIPSTGKLTTAMVDRFDVTNFSDANAVGTYRDQKSADSTNIADYTWSQFKGDDGESVTITSHSVTYAVTNNVSQPADNAFTSSSVPSVGVGQYLWSKTEVRYSDGKTTKSYSVSRIGSDGENGTPGAPGSNGKTTYVHIAYANSADGTSGFKTTYFTGALYIGTCTDYNEADPTTPSSYEWARLKGEDGSSSLKSIVFIRSASAPNKPSGGSYSSPVPSGWSDGIPAENGQPAWMSSRVFTSDGLAPQTSEWTSPQKVSDTADIDFEFSAVENNPGTPSTNASNWHNAATPNDIWMAVRKSSNGVWGSWEVSKIKGEEGVPGRSYNLEASTLTMMRGKDGGLSPASVTFSQYYYDGENVERVALKCRFIIAESTNGTSFTNKYTSSTDEQSKTWTPSSKDVVKIRCTSYAAGGTSYVLDMQSVDILTDVSYVEDLIDEYAYLKEALKGKTELSGGLMLSSLIELGLWNSAKTDLTVYSGINGVALETEKGKGIAAWYGGDMLDGEKYDWVNSATNRYAQSLFRFDGSGYLAGGNISWNADGSGQLAGGNIHWDTTGSMTFGSGITLNVSNVSGLQNTLNSIANFMNNLSNWLTPVDKNYNPISWQAAFTSEDFFAIRANKGFYSSEWISAFGANANAGGGGGASYLYELLDVADSVVSPSDKQVLTYSSSQKKWVAQAAQVGLDTTQLGNYLTQNGYLTNATAGNTYVKKSGDTMTGALNVDIDDGVEHITFGRASYNYIRARSSGGTINFLTNGASVAAVNVTLRLEGKNGVPGTTNVGTWGSSSLRWSNVYSVLGNFSGALTATSFVKSGGTSSQFLKADGSVDSNAYLTTSSAESTYVKKSGDTMTGTLTLTNATPLKVSSTTKVDNLNADMVDGLHSTALVVANSKQTILSMAGNGQYTYARIATFTITSAYTNNPAIFEVFGRGITHTILTVIPNNDSGTDPNVLLYSNNSNRFYIRKSATSTWELYCQYIETWGTLFVRQLFGNYGMTVTLNGTNVSSLPSGCVQASAVGMAEYASKLATPRTLWGNSFDGSGNVSGFLTGWSGCSTNLTDVWNDGTNTHTWYGIDHRTPNTGVFSTTISDYFGLTLKTNQGNVSITNSGNVGIGTTSPSYKLQVAGTLYASGATTLASTLSVSGQATVGSLKIGNAVLSWDATNSALKISTGMYSEQWISVFGANSSATGGGGGVSYLSDLLDTTISSPKSGQVLQYNGSKWVNANIQTISGNYLPLSGGTINGNLTVNGLVSLGDKSIDNCVYILGNDVDIVTGYSLNLRSDDYVYVKGTLRLDGVVRPETNNKYSLGTSSFKWSNVYTQLLNVSGAATLSSTLSVTGNTTIGGTLNVSGNVTITKETDNYIITKNSKYALRFGIGSGGTNRGLYDETVGSWIIYMDSTTNVLMPNGNVGIGTTSPSYKLHVVGGGFNVNNKSSIDANGNAIFGATAFGTTSHRKNTGDVWINGTTYLGGDTNNQIWFDSSNGILHFDASEEINFDQYVRCNAGFSQSSDIRMKELVNGYFNVDVDDIARAPAITYRMKGKKRIEVGTIAQYWRCVVPESVEEDSNGYLSMQYSNLALVSAISIARKVVNHEERIAQLEKENKELREQIELLAS